MVGAGGGLRTHGLLRERISYRDPIFFIDLKSAAFDRAWLLPLCSAKHSTAHYLPLCGILTLQLFGSELVSFWKWWGGPDSNQRPSSSKSTKLRLFLGVNETS